MRQIRRIFHRWLQFAKLQHCPRQSRLANDNRSSQAQHQSAPNQVDRFRILRQHNVKYPPDATSSSQIRSAADRRRDRHKMPRANTDKVQRSHQPGHISHTLTQTHALLLRTRGNAAPKYRPSTLLLSASGNIRRQHTRRSPLHALQRASVKIFRHGRHQRRNAEHRHHRCSSSLRVVGITRNHQPSPSQYAQCENGQRAENSASRSSAITASPAPSRSRKLKWRGCKRHHHAILGVASVFIRIVAAALRPLHLPIRRKRVLTDAGPTSHRPSAGRSHPANGSIRAFRAAHQLHPEPLIAVLQAVPLRRFADTAVLPNSSSSSQARTQFVVAAACGRDAGLANSPRRLGPRLLQRRRPLINFVRPHAS